MISRNIIALIIIALISITAGILGVFYVRGYSIGRDENNGQPVFTKGGNLVVETDPRNASFYLNNELKGTTDKKLANLNVGNYVVRLELKDHRVWEKNIEIIEGLVTWVDINLFKSEITTKVVDTEFKVSSIKASFPKLQRKLIEDNTGSLYIADFTRNIIKNDYTFTKIVGYENISELAITSDTIYDLSPDSSKLLLFDTKTKEARIINANSLNTDFTNILLNFGTTADEAKFANNSENILIKSANSYFSYNTRSNKTTLLVNTEIYPIYSFAKDGYGVLNDDGISVYDYSSSSIENIKFENILNYSKDMAFNQLEVSDDLDSILLVSKELLYFYNSDTKELDLLNSKFGEFIGFSPDQNKALYCSDNKLNFSILNTLKSHGFQRSGVIYETCDIGLYFEKDSKNMLMVTKNTDDLSLVSVADYDGQNSFIVVDNQKVLSDPIFTNDLKVIIVLETTTDTGSEIEISELTLR